MGIETLLDRQLNSSGENVVEGFIEGIEKDLDALKEIGGVIGEAVQFGTDENLGIESPAKRYIRKGYEVVKGFIIGIRNGFDEVEEVGEELGDELAEGTSESTNRFKDFFSTIGDRFPILKKFKGLLLGVSALFIGGMGLNFAINLLNQLSKQALATAMAFESLDRAIVFVSRNGIEGMNNLNFISSEAKRLTVVKKLKDNSRNVAFYLTVLSILLGVGTYFAIDIPENHKNARSEAWQILNSSLEQSGSGGRIIALESLNKWANDRKNNWFSQWNWSEDIADYIRGEKIQLKGVRANNAFLGGIELQGAELNYANFQDSNLWKAEFENASLKQVNFQRAFLRNANLSGAKLNGANLNGADLGEAKLLKLKNVETESNDNSVDLTGAKLIGASLINTNLEGIDFNKEKPPNMSRSVISPGTNIPKKFQEIKNDLYLIEPGKNFTGKDFTNVNFGNANLSRVILKGANLNGANLSQTNGLESAVLDGMIYTEKTKFPDGFRIRQDKTYLIKPGVNLTKAELKDSNLSGLNLIGVNFTKADLENANLAGANLDRAIFSEETILKNACYDKFTKFTSDPKLLLKLEHKGMRFSEKGCS